MKNKLLAAPYLVWMVLFTIVPLGIVAYFSFSSFDGSGFTLENLKAVVDYLPVFGRSVFYAVAAAVICLVIGYPVAYAIAQTSPATQRTLYMLVMLPMCMSFLLRTLALVALLRDTGIINNFLDSIGIGRLTLIRTPGAVILGMVYNYLPYMIMPLYSVIVKIDPRLIEAASDLGCNRKEVFKRVIVPLSVPGIISGVTMVFVPAVSTFYISLKLGSTETTLIGDIIERQFKSAQNPYLGAALSLALMLLVVFCIWLMNRFSGDGEEVMMP